MSNMELSLCNAIIKNLAYSIVQTDLFFKEFLSLNPNKEDKNLIINIIKDNSEQAQLLNNLHILLNQRPISVKLSSEISKLKNLDDVHNENYTILQNYYKLRSICVGDDLKSLVSNIIIYNLRNSNRIKILLSKHLNKPNDSYFSREDAIEIAEKIGFDLSSAKFTVDDFVVGLNIELEHGTKSPLTNVTNDDPYLTGKIALAHLLEFPDYYVRLTKLEEEAKDYWGEK